MTHKQRMFSALLGESTDLMPWAPRLDLWYRANKRAGTLPPGHEQSSLDEIVDALGAGFHAILPDFKDTRSIDDELDRALGIYNLRVMPYRTVFENVERTVESDDDRTTVRYKTPFGAIETTTLYDEGMRRAGITISHIEKHVFRSADDYKTLEYLFENARVEANYEGYSDYAAMIGDRGLAAAFVNLAGSPMHLIQRELMPLDVFFYEIFDHSEQLQSLANKIGFYWQRVMDVVVECPAEVVFVGANYDTSITNPPFFHEHIQPWLKRYADELHSRSKFLLTHTDGENTGLLQHYVDSGIDIADSICPLPMTKLSYKHVKDFFVGKITIMGGIPSVALLPSAMPDREFDAFLEAFFADAGRGEHMILGISDTTPPGVDWNRLLKIGRMVCRFGPVTG